MSQIEERQLSHAMYALRKIANRIPARGHVDDPHNTCGCATCCAKDALEQIERIGEEPK